MQKVAKHAKARTVRIRLYLQRDKMVLEVADDGTGFDPAAPDDSGTSTGFGLAGMRERAELLSGKLELSSAPHRGTTVRLMLPFTSPAQLPRR